MLKKIVTDYIILLTVLLCAANGHALEVRINKDKFSLHADQVPLQTILQHMSDAGIRVRIDPKLNPNISASFENRKIQEGLETILRPFSHVLMWESGKAASRQTFKLAEIQVFRPGRKELMQPLEKRSGLSVAKNAENGSLFVRDELLLKLRPGMNISDLKALLSQIRGTIIGKNAATGIYKIRVPGNTDVPTLSDLITKYSRIAKAEPNYAYPISIPRSLIPSDLGNISIPAPNGKAPIAILDTGLIPDSVPEDFVLSALDALNPEAPISDSQGHGTQMALIAAGVVRPHGVSPQQGQEKGSYTPVIPIRAFDENGITSDFGIMRSIDFAMKNGARVMSLSWGSETKSDFLEDAFDYADAKGLIIVGAAGNEPTGKAFYPAAYESVIGVGALAPDGTPWENSNYGNFVTLSAPGFATLPVGYDGDPGAYAGTSIATAFVANRIAEYLSENPEATKQDVANVLRNDFH
ncbi:S8 family peptidase [Desulfonema magnum]|uniref:Peptidase S8/S53 domain-containing protein n=1 Tax=Desulfonema magnum TaxID=45655 RepID=A0A975GSJ0_9BACT|nr:S8 family serine peptidase [Desulfonema magnum]QTA91138.1 Peptidase S8/S53 domain-containing protein [Desulfonema magnum]